MSVKVSVIMPCYNVKDTVTYSINSLKRQTFKDFELIIIDDGSKDSTLEIVNNNLQDSNINAKIIHKENEGVAAARNDGIEQATGEYIAFLDADDIMDDRFLEIMVREYENCDVTFCKLKKINDIKYQNLFDNEVKCTVMNNDELIDNLMYRTVPTMFSDYLYKRQIIVDNFLRFTRNVHYGEDTEFLWKYIVNCKCGKAVNCSLYYYYYNNPKSALHNLNWDKVQSADGIKRIYEYMKQKEHKRYDDFYEYMYPRTLIAIYKAFIKNNKNEFAKKFEREYELKRYMKVLKKSPDIKIRCTAWMYMINPAVCKMILKRI